MTRTPLHATTNTQLSRAHDFEHSQNPTVPVADGLTGQWIGLPGGTTAHRVGVQLGGPVAGRYLRPATEPGLWSRVVQNRFPSRNLSFCLGCGRGGGAGGPSGAAVRRG